MLLCVQSIFGFMIVFALLDLGVVIGDDKYDKKHIFFALINLMMPTVGFICSLMILE